MMSTSELFSRTPRSLFVSPFGISGVPVGADSSGPVVSWETTMDVDEASFCSTRVSGSPGVGGARGRDVTIRSTQNVALRNSDDSSHPLPDPMYEKEIRRAEAHLPGVVGCETTCRAETISMGEKITKNAKKQQTLRSGMEASDSGAAAIEGAKNGKSGWGVISRNFAVSSALSSLNRDLKTFGTRPHEAAIDRERSTKAVHTPRFMIAPGTVLHRRYSWLNVVLLIYCAFTIPVRVSFDFELGNFMSIVEFVIDVFFMLDVFVNFRTGYVLQEDGEEPVVVTDAKMVARHYLRTWFCVDTLSALPINFFVGHETLGGANRVPRLIRIPRIIRLMRLIRLLRLLKLLQTTSVIDHLSSAGMHPRLLRALKLVFVTFIGSHVTACCWHFLHTLETSEDLAAPSWWNAYCLTALPDEHANIMCEVDLPTRYTISLYWAVTTLTTIGYGDILPVTFMEYAYTIFCMYVGVSFYAFIAANVATVLASLDTNTQLHNQKMDKLNEFLKATKMPSSLRRRLRKYFSLYWTQLGALMPYDTRKLIEEINLPALRSEVTAALYKDTLARIPFLHNREANFVTNIVTKLVPLHVLQRELVVREGEVGTNIFFLFNGKVASMYRERTVKYMVPGSYFGDVAVLLTERHLMSYRAHGICDLYILSKDDLSYALQHFPHYTFEMRELAVSRLAAMNEDIETLNKDASSSDSVMSTSTTLEPVIPTEGSVDTQAQVDRHSSVRSSVVSEMFDERLSERMNQLLSNDGACESRHTHPRDQHGRNGFNYDRSKYSSGGVEESGAVVGQEVTIPTTVPSAREVQNHAPAGDRSEDLHDDAVDSDLFGVRQLSTGGRPTSSAHARAQAKVVIKTSHATPIDMNCGVSTLGHVADAARCSNPEQLLARRVVDATAVLSDLMAVLEQVLAHDHMAGDTVGETSTKVAQTELATNAGDEPTTPLTCVEEGDDEEEEEEQTEQQQGEDAFSSNSGTATGTGNRNAKQLLSTRVHGASAPPPAPLGSSRGFFGGKPAPRSNRLRRKDTAATGALAN